MPLLPVGKLELFGFLILCALPQYIFRMLGYGQGIPERGSAYGSASVYDVFKLTDTNCNGKEESLEDCFYRFGNCWLQMKLKQFSNENMQQLHQVYLPQNTFFRNSQGCSRGKVAGVTCFAGFNQQKFFHEMEKFILNMVTKMLDLKTSIV